jgi:hypothetical protein
MFPLERSPGLNEGSPLLLKLGLRLLARGLLLTELLLRRGELSSKLVLSPLDSLAFSLA